MYNKELCDCGKVAVWDYMPGYSGGGNSYSCDDCVHRGCSCNYNSIKEHPDYLPEGVEGIDWVWVEIEDDDILGKITKESGYWQYVDENGRPRPCCEYWYSEEGWEVDDAN